MNNLIIFQYHLNFSSLRSIMAFAQSNFLKSIGSRAKMWDVYRKQLGTPSRNEPRQKRGIQKRRRERRKKGGQYKRKSAEGKRDTMDHPRERFRTGWESTAHAVFLRGVLILFAYSGTIRNQRDLSADLSLPSIILSVQLYFCVRSILDTHIQETLSSCQDFVISHEALPSIWSFNFQALIKR